MRIFIGYHFNPRDAWVKAFVYPIIRAFGHEVVTGENLYGDGPIGPAVADRIRDSQALIGFSTRREKKENVKEWTTHRWVTDELATAKGVPRLEVREDGVDPQRGILDGTQYILYKEADLAKCLVDLVEAIGQWTRLWYNKREVRLQLIPDGVVNEIARYVRKDRFNCTYSLLEDGVDPTQPSKAQVLELTGGLFVRILGVPRGARVQVRVDYMEKSWVSIFENIESPSVLMRLEGN